jgi:hypothetical protein
VEAARRDFDNLDYGIIKLGWEKLKIAQVRSLRRTMFERWTNIHEEVCQLEEEISIQERWTVDSPSYQQGLILLQERKYRCALDKLEMLVVQRLFELTKLGLSSIGKS